MSLVVARRWGPPVAGWELSPHPDESPYAVDTSAPRTPPAGYGVLRLRVGSVYAGRLAQGVPRPQAPVVLVDSAPATQGWGESWIAVPAGQRLIEVQAGMSRVLRPVSVPAGGTVELDYLHLLPHRFDSGEREAVLGPRDRVELPTQVRRRSDMWVLLTFLATAVLVSPLVMLLAGTGRATGVPVLLPVLTAACVFALRPFRVRRVLAESRMPPTSVERDGFGMFLLDPDGGEPPSPPSGWGAVVVDAAFTVSPNGRDRLAELLAETGAGRDGRRLAGDLLTVGEPLPLPHRPWVGPVRLDMDGRALRLPWGTWFVLVTPGRHDLVLSVPPPSDAVLDAATVVDTGDARHEASVAVAAGEVVRVGYGVAVTMAVRGEGPALARFAALRRPDGDGRG